MTLKKYSLEIYLNNSAEQEQWINWLHNKLHGYFVNLNPTESNISAKHSSTYYFYAEKFIKLSSFTLTHTKLTHIQFLQLLKDIARQLSFTAFQTFTIDDIYMVNDDIFLLYPAPITNALSLYQTHSSHLYLLHVFSTVLLQIYENYLDKFDLTEVDKKEIEDCINTMANEHKLCFTIIRSA